MLTISNRQMTALDDYYLGKYIEGKKEKYAEGLLVEQPGLFQREVFKEWIREARNFGIVTMGDSDRYVELHLQYPAMRERPLNEEFRYLLTHPSLDATRKLNLLTEKNDALVSE